MVLNLNGSSGSLLLTYLTILLPPRRWYMSQCMYIDKRRRKGQKDWEFCLCWFKTFELSFKGLTINYHGRYQVFVHKKGAGHDNAPFVGVSSCHVQKGSKYENAPTISCSPCDSGKHKNPLGLNGTSDLMPKQALARYLAASGPETTA